MEGAGIAARVGTYMAGLWHTTAHMTYLKPIVDVTSGCLLLHGSYLLFDQNQVKECMVS